MAKVTTERSTIARILSARVTDPSFFNLLFQWYHEVFGERMVGRFEYLACSHTTSIQHHPAGNYCSLEIFSACRRNFDLSHRDWLPDFYLAKENALCLARGHHCDARRNRSRDGN